MDLDSVFVHIEAHGYAVDLDVVTERDEVPRLFGRAYAGYARGGEDVAFLDQPIFDKG